MERRRGLPFFVGDEEVACNGHLPVKVTCLIGLTQNHEPSPCLFLNNLSYPTHTAKKFPIFRIIANLILINNNKQKKSVNDIRALLPLQ